MKVKKFIKKSFNKNKVFFIKATILSLVVLISIVLLLNLSSCITIRINKIQGSGKIIKEEFNVNDFNMLLFSGIGKIYIEQGDEESLVVEAEDNILRAINVNVIGNRLDISLQRGFISVVPTRDIKFFLKVKDLNDIEITGAGSIYCEKLDVDRLEIKSSGVGNVEMNLIADEVEVLISGAGKVNIEGEVDTQQIRITGVGSYNAKNLISNNCEVDISGAGKAIVNATENLDISMSGFGRVEYVGNPSVKQNISGGGIVKSID